MATIEVHEEHENHSRLNATERLGSAALGIALVGTAARGFPRLRLLALAVGTGLVTRAVTGRTPLLDLIRGVKRRASRSVTDHDRVDEASDESFPASDPPSFTP